MGTVIVGVDGSETAALAAEIAAGLAAAAGDELVLLVAHQFPGGNVVSGPGNDVWHLSGHDAARNTGIKQATRLGRKDVTVEVAAGVGSPAEVLLEEADRREARLIVVGNRRMRGMGRLLGSVANEVAHHATCDVYIAKTT